MNTTSYIRPDIHCASKEMPKSIYQLHANRIRNAFLTVMSECLTVRLGYQEQRFYYLWFNTVNGTCGVTRSHGHRSPEWELLGKYPIGVICYDDLTFSEFVMNSSKEDATKVYLKLKSLLGKWDIEKLMQPDEKNNGFFFKSTNNQGFFNQAAENEAFFSYITFSKGPKGIKSFDEEMYEIQKKFERNFYRDFVLNEWNKIKKKYEI